MEENKNETEADKANDIETRLKDATEACLKAHAAWSKDQQDSAIRSALMDAVHELRKIGARFEIEIAISERNEMTAKPIPIPSHRSNKRKHHDTGEDNRGNSTAGNRQTTSSRPPSNNRPRRKPAGGSNAAPKKAS